MRKLYYLEQSLAKFIKMNLLYFRPIYPCRSLCNKVRAGCEGMMETYGYPWPAMFDCGKFPQDNDMCITAQSAERGNRGDATLLAHNGKSWRKLGLSMERSL
jgi:hypothetical protein